MNKLIDLIPVQYRNSQEVVELQQALQKWADKLSNDRDDLFDQFDVKSATWGLRAWEAALGLDGDISNPYDQRRERIESKLRGLGTTTKEMIANVAASFSNGAVNVVEHNDEYSFDIIFTGSIGIPPNMDDLSAAIEEIKPAHLVFAYIYIYRTWSVISYLNWDDAGVYTWDQLREGSL